MSGEYINPNYPEKQPKIEKWDGSVISPAEFSAHVDEIIKNASIINLPNQDAWKSRAKEIYSNMFARLLLTMESRGLNLEELDENDLNAIQKDCLDQLKEEIKHPAFAKEDIAASRYLGNDTNVQK